MKKICLSVIGLYCMLLSSFGQSDTSYHSKKLTLEEANLVTGYYNQTGDHSAVTGGIGTEKLSDVSNIIDLEFVKWNEKNNKYTWTLGLGVDHHTSASQAYVSATGASRAGGTRIYPSDPRGSFASLSQASINPFVRTHCWCKVSVASELKKAMNKRI